MLNVWRFLEITLGAFIAVVLGIGQLKHRQRLSREQRSTVPPSTATYRPLRLEPCPASAATDGRHGTGAAGDIRPSAFLKGGFFAITTASTS